MPEGKLDPDVKKQSMPMDMLTICDKIIDKLE